MPAIQNALQPAQPHAIQAPLDFSGFFDNAVEHAAAAPKKRRPVVPIANNPLRIQGPRPLTWTGAKKRVPLLAPSDLVLVGLLLGLMLAAWISLLIGLNLAQAAERTTSICMTQTDVPAISRAASDRKLCDRLPHQG